MVNLRAVGCPVSLVRAQRSSTGAGRTTAAGRKILGDQLRLRSCYCLCSSQASGRVDGERRVRRDPPTIRLVVEVILQEEEVGGG